MKYNKLVRDKIPEVIAKNGGNPKTHVASDKKFWGYLTKKLREELKEFVNAETDKDRAEEFADVQEVLDAMFEHLGLTKKYVRHLQKKKAEEKGRFKKRIILDEA